jgi:hypothetical protein
MLDCYTEKSKGDGTTLKRLREELEQELLELSSAMFSAKKVHSSQPSVIEIDADERPESNYGDI